MSDFDKKLDAQLDAAKAKLTSRAQVEQDAKDAEQRQQQSNADRLAHAKSHATRFKHNKLEKLLRATQQKVTEKTPEFHMIGDYDDEQWNDGGSLAKLLRGGECILRASIDYDLDKLTSRLTVVTPDQGQIYDQHQDYPAQDFNHEAAARWFEENLPEAVGAMLGSGEVPRSPVVRYVKK